MINSQRRRAAAPFFAFLLGVLALGLTACGSRETGSIPYRVGDFGAPDAPEKAQLDHKIGPGDILAVTVYQVPSLSGDQVVDGTGNITMPLIGAVNAQGSTASELALVLQQKLGVRYIQSPQVLVTLKGIVQRSVTVDGTVTQPGVYPIAAHTTLIEAISLARGPKDGANLKRVVIFRHIKGQRQAAAFNLVDIRNGREPDPEVYGDDVIVVDGSGVKSAFRTLLQGIPLLAVFRPF